MIEDIQKWLSDMVASIGQFFTGLWDKFLQWYNDFTAWIWGKVCDAAEAVHWFFLDEEDGWIWWLVEKLYGCGEWFLEQLPSMSELIEEYTDPYRTTMELVGRIDLFVPVTEAVTLFGIFIGLLVAFLTAKLAFKLLPWVG